MLVVKTNRLLKKVKARARDLKNTGYSVTVADINDSLKTYLKTFSINYIKIDFNDTKSLHKVLQNYNLIIGAVPGFMGYQILKEISQS